MFILCSAIFVNIKTSSFDTAPNLRRWRNYYLMSLMSAIISRTTNITWLFSGTLSAVINMYFPSLSCEGITWCLYLYVIVRLLPCYILFERAVPRCSSTVTFGGCRWVAVTPHTCLVEGRLVLYHGSKKGGKISRVTFCIEKLSD